MKTEALFIEKILTLKETFVIAKIRYLIYKSWLLPCEFSCFFFLSFKDLNPDLF